MPKVGAGLGFVAAVCNSIFLCTAFEATRADNKAGMRHRGHHPTTKSDEALMAPPSQQRKHGQGAVGEVDHWGRTLMRRRDDHQRANVRSMLDVPECEGRKQEWVEEDGIRRLKGPVIHFHIQGPYSVVGRTLFYMANKNGMFGQMYHRWDSPSVPDGDQNPEYGMWKDRCWTDLEETFGYQQLKTGPQKQHTLADLGCATNKAILSIAIRHPLNMVLHRSVECDADKDHCQNGLNVCPLSGGPCVFDNHLTRNLAGKCCCGLGSEMHVSECVQLTPADLDLAKYRARQMDLIFIVEHLGPTMQLGRTRLGWKDASLPSEGHQAEEQQNIEVVKRLTREDFQLLEERNRFDIELYEYMRDLSFDMLREDGLAVPTAEEKLAAVPRWADTELLMMMPPVFHENVEVLRFVASLTNIA